MESLFSQVYPQQSTRMRVMELDVTLPAKKQRLLGKQLSKLWSWWSAEKTEKLKRYWLEGLSSTQIGTILGCTRNSVIGKVHRLGLEQRYKSPVKREKKPKKVII